MPPYLLTPRDENLKMCLGNLELVPMEIKLYCRGDLILYYLGFWCWFCSRWCWSFETFIKFLAFPMRRLFKGGVYSRAAFISKSYFLNH